MIFEILLATFLFRIWSLLPIGTVLKCSLLYVADKWTHAFLDTELNFICHVSAQGNLDSKAGWFLQKCTVRPLKPNSGSILADTE